MLILRADTRSSMPGRQGHLRNHARILLSYVAQHRDERQTYARLAAAIGVPYETTRRLIQYGLKDPNRWFIGQEAARLGYSVLFLGRRGRILDVVDLRCSQDANGRLLVNGLPEYHVAEGADELPTSP